MAGKKELVTIKVTPKMAGLVTLISQIQNGKIEGLIVVKGEPCSVNDVRQRLDFDKADELSKIFERRAITIDAGEPLEITFPEPEPEPAAEELEESHVEES